MVTNVIQNGLILPLTMLGNFAIAFAALFFFAPYLGLLFLIAGVDIGFVLGDCREP